MTKRAQELKVVDSEVVERRRINKLKDLIIQGLRPDEAERALEDREKGRGKRKQGDDAEGSEGSKGKKAKGGAKKAGKVRKAKSAA